MEGLGKPKVQPPEEAIPGVSEERLKDPDFMAQLVIVASDTIEYSHPNKITKGEANPIIVENYIRTHLNELGVMLFKAARSAYGANKITYATALMELRIFVESDEYIKMLQGLMSNIGSVEELIKQGKNEASMVSKFKKLFKITG